MENNFTYYGKIETAGKNIQYTYYDKKQYRSRKKSNSRFQSDVENNCIIDNVTGEIIENFEQLLYLYLDSEITKEQLFYSNFKLRYSLMSKVQRTLENKAKSLKRTKKEIVNKINSNIDYSNLKGLKFLTLTFKENIADIKQANLLFKNKIAQLQELYGKIKYIAILENQERGAVHYHCILFNAPYMEHKILSKIWNVGSVNIQSLLFRKKKYFDKVKNEWINTDERVVEITYNSDTNEVLFNNIAIKNIGNYITKSINYVIKDIVKSIDDILDLKDDEKIIKYIEESKNQIIFTKNAKLFQCSRGLNKAEVEYIEIKEKAKELKSSISVMYFENYNEFTIEYDDSDFLVLFGEITYINCYDLKYEFKDCLLN